MHAFFGEGRKRDEQTNGQTHIGGWVENVTNGRTDERTVKMGTDGRTNGKLFSKVGCHETCRVKFGILNIW